jgi:putative transposase
LPDELRERLAGLLNEEALEEAVQGLEPEDLTGPGGLLTQLAGRVIEAALDAERSEHLGYPPGETPPQANRRNGGTPKTLKTDLGPVEIRTPRDRDASFEPQLVKKRQTRIAGLDDRVLDMYAGGMSTRDIAAHLTSLYGVEVGRDTISRVTDAVLQDITAWRSRPLDELYPIVYFDAMTVKVREDRSVQNRCCYLAVGVTLDGDRDCLGIWWRDVEGAKFWLAVLNDLHQRGLKDILIACVDGLTGFPEAIGAVFPDTWVQTCIVHMIRASTKYVSYRDRKKVSAALRPVYTAANEQDALAELERFDSEWGRAIPNDRPALAPRLGAHHPVPLAARPATQSGLHHEFDRRDAPPGPQSDQNPRPLPRRTSRHQAHLPRNPTRRNQMAIRARLDKRATRPQDPLRRPNPRLT